MQENKKDNVCSKEASTVALRYYNYCIDGSASPGNYGYRLVYSNVTTSSYKEQRFYVRRYDGRSLPHLSRWLLPWLIL
jgi:hypothetical protein